MPFFFLYRFKWLTGAVRKIRMANMTFSAFLCKWICFQHADFEGLIFKINNYLIFPALSLTLL